VTLNPFRPLLDFLRESHQREERRAELERLDRQAMMETLATIASASIEVSRSNAEVMKTFLASFAVDEAPRVREWDEDADNARYKKRLSESNLDEYMKLVEKLDRFALD